MELEAVQGKPFTSNKKFLIIIVVILLIIGTALGIFFSLWIKTISSDNSNIIVPLYLDNDPSSYSNFYEFTTTHVEFEVAPIEAKRFRAVTAKYTMICLKNSSIIALTTTSP